MENSGTGIDRKALRILCDFHGGIRRTAETAGIDDGNLSKWLRGKPTLSEANVLTLLHSVGLPNGNPREDIVYGWRLKNTILKNIVPALKLFFNESVLIAEAPWSAPKLKYAGRTIRPYKYCDNVFALFDGNVRAVLRFPTNFTISDEHIHKFVKWKTGNRNTSVIDIDEKDTQWTEGVPTIKKFDAAWNGTNVASTIEDVEATIQHLGISLDEAIDILKTYS